MNIMQTVNRYHLRRILTSPSLVSLFVARVISRKQLKLVRWQVGIPRIQPQLGEVYWVYGKKSIEHIFDRQFSNKFNIHRTKQYFLTLGEMASSEYLLSIELYRREQVEA